MLEKTTDKVFQALLERMKSDLTTTDHVAVTTDIWSTKQLIDSFLGVTAHFWNKDLGRSESFRIGKMKTMFNQTATLNSSSSVSGVQLCAYWRQYSRGAVFHPQGIWNRDKGQVDTNGQRNKHAEGSKRKLCCFNKIGEANYKYFSGCSCLQ